LVDGSTVDHSAAASALGYLYQINWALVELIRRGGSRPDQSVTLELHDDVAWDQAGHPIERIQVKHHLNRQYGLTDANPDVWRTLKAWMDVASPADPNGALLVLVTTASAPSASAAHLLRPVDRDEPAALDLLETAARDSDNQATAAARRQFLGLSRADREVFITRIHVCDGQPPVTDLNDELRVLLWLSMPSDSSQAETYLELVWRWWSSVCLDLLTGTRESVDVQEVRQQLATIREMFHADNLPTLVELDDVDESTTVELHFDRNFVHQMRWVRLRVDNLRTAIVDYHRAVTQTTNWLDRDLIGIAELERFERNLVDEWRRAYSDMLEDLPDDVSEDQKVEVGRRLLRQLRDSTAVHVRSRYTDTFFARGKRHELADAGTIGWHPDFQNLLERLLSETGDVAAGGSAA
jgi:hypothetical protein